MPQRGAPQFGASLPHDRRRERPVGPGQFHSERRIRAGRVVPPGRCGFAMVRRSGGATARPLESIWASLPHDRRRERPVGPGQFHSERRIRAGRVVPPGRCGFARCAAAGAQLPGHWSDLEPLCRMVGRERPVGPGQFHSERRIRAVWCLPAVRICHGAPQRGRNCPATGFDLASLPHVGRTGPVLPGGADLPWCAAAWAPARPLDSIWASLPHDRRRERPVDRASFIQRGESERAVWCPGPAGAQLRFGASLPHGRRRERPVGPGQFHGASRAVRICHGAPQQGRNCPATGFDLEPLCRMVAIVKHWPNRRPTTKITDWN